MLQGVVSCPRFLVACVSRPEVRRTVELRIRGLREARENEKGEGMKFKDLEEGEKFQVPAGIDLSGFGPVCPTHGQSEKSCVFIKTKSGPPPRSYFGSNSGFRNAKRVCDDTAYDFSSVWEDVAKLD